MNKNLLIFQSIEKHKFLKDSIGEENYEVFVNFCLNKRVYSPHRNNIKYARIIYILIKFF